MNFLRVGQRAVVIIRNTDEFVCQFPALGDEGAGHFLWHEKDFSQDQTSER